MSRSDAERLDVLERELMGRDEIAQEFEEKITTRMDSIEKATKDIPELIELVRSLLSRITFLEGQLKLRNMAKKNTDSGNGSSD